jgi:putative flippase GtrA
MIKSTFAYFWSVRREFAKYFIVGFSGLFFDMGTLILFKEKFGMAPVVAVILNQVILLNYNFLLNKYWSFKNKAMPHKQLVKYLSLAGFNYLFSVVTMYFFNHILNFDYRFVRIVTIATMVSWNFFLYKYWVYKAEKTQSEVLATVNNLSSLNN